MACLLAASRLGLAPLTVRDAATSDPPAPFDADASPLSVLLSLRLRLIDHLIE